MPSNSTFTKNIWSLITPYWKSAEKGSAYLLLITIIVLDLGQVYMQVLINAWYNGFYGSLQQLNKAAFIKSIIHFSYLAVIFIIIAVYSIYLSQMLTVRWRRWMTHTYLEKWLQKQSYYRMQVTGHLTDNPDQRISEDIAQFTTATLALSLGLLSAIVTFCSFITILWKLSGPANFQIEGVSIHIPGYMVWAALAYAILGTWFTNKIGRPLVHLNFNQQRLEANFRFGMARLRENSESVAFYKGEPQEKQGLTSSFSSIFSNFWQIMRYRKRLSWFTSFYGQAAIIFPYLVAAPRLFTKEIDLGGLMQIVNAFDRVQTALSYIITAYSDIAVWKATSDRLITFNEHMQQTTQAAGFTASYTKLTHIEAKDLTIKLPNQQTLLTKLNFRLNPAATCLVTGPSGCGKTSVLRTLAGIWPFAEGQLFIPETAKILFLPQKPYLPLATLKQALYYPSSDSIADEQAKEILQLCQLGPFYDRLHQDSDWSRTLSLGEQQRIAIARAILVKPDFLFLDEATSNLDEAAEHYLYQLLRAQCPNTCLVSVAHRSTLKAWHDEELILA
jgi:putative ATP-binding cassette transporter